MGPAHSGELKLASSVRRCSGTISRPPKMMESMLLQKKSLQYALEDRSLTKIESRKLKNRLSALESRCRTQEHIASLTGHVERLKDEVKRSIEKLMKYEGEVDSSRQEYVNELLEQQFFKLETKKRVREKDFPHTSSSYDSSNESSTASSSSADAFHPSPVTTRRSARTARDRSYSITTDTSSASSCPSDCDLHFPGGSMSPPTMAMDTATSTTMFWSVGAPRGARDLTDDDDELLLLPNESTSFDLFEDDADEHASKCARWLPLDISSDDEAALFADLLEL